MKLQDLSLEQLKEIVEGAPEGATHYDYDDGLYLKTAYDGAYWFSAWSGWSHMDISATEFIKANFPSLGAISAELEPVFKVGDRVVPQSDAVNLIRAVREVLEVDGDQIRYHMEAQVRSYWSKAKGWRHATPEEIAAGHRIDEPSSSCGMSGAEIDQFGEDLRKKPYVDFPEFEQPDNITTQLDPAKCHKVNPALPYDEPLTERELKAPAGMKHDQSKPRYSLIPAGALEAIVGVLEYGATKYAPDNWKHVENARERYYNASMRHIQSWWIGEQNDPETGLPHLAHAVCSLMFLMALKGEQGE